MEFVNGECTTDQDCTKDRGVHGDKLPHCRVVVAPDFQFHVKYRYRKTKPANPVVVCPEGNDSRESSIWFWSVQIPRSYII